MPHLIIHQGGSERVHAFASHDVTIGRHHNNDVQIEDPRVSRHHAAIFRDDEGGYVLRDLGSKNHTKLNDRVVHRAPLSEGDRIRIGDAVLQYKEQKAAPKKRGRVRVARSGREREGRSGGEVDSTTHISTLITRVESIIDILPGEADLEASHRRLVKLYQVGKTISSILDTHELLERILHIASDAVRAERGFIALLDPKTEALTYEAVLGVDPEGEAPGDTIEMSRVIVHRVLDENQSLLVEDCRSDEHFRSLSRPGAPTISTLLCVPLREKMPSLGLLYLDSTDPDRRFAPGDLDFLMALSGQAAVAIENAVLHTKVRRGYSALEERMRLHGKIVGRSPKIRALFEEIEKVAPVDATVLIRGESGTGKELVASALHYQSARDAGPFIKVNCAAIPDTLLESELFGYEPNSGISGADPRGKPGKFELAHGGSIFLDEIGDMNMTTQAKMLRVLQEKEVDRLGATEPVRVDVRIIAATNQGIEGAIEAGRFREDLYHRLKVIQLRVPAVRERKEDVPLLANYFLDKHARQFGRPTGRISYRAMSILMGHDWRANNVRELENAIASAIVLGGGEVILPEDLPQEVREGARLVSGAFPSLSDVARAHIVRALKHTRGNISEAASILRINRGTLYNKMREYEISAERYKIVPEGV